MTKGLEKGLVRGHLLPQDPFAPPSGNLLHWNQEEIEILSMCGPQGFHVQTVMASENGFNGTGPVKTALATKDGLYMGTLNAAQPTGGPQQSMDMSDPNVKKLVYNLYRGLLGTYNDKANDVVASCPDAFVTEDQGIARQVESML
ncbi:hypothetical protein QYM36_000015 [Artemia franciscana]|uniref:Uncharacterized protein n=1 Tax=Artemia franciscana TaxID=6661 RepID=A0AA88LBL9_ARTSF|nr:hypothetical protein QYM36_000015 [Artemia franciscana]